MSPRLVAPQAAVDAVALRIERDLADLVSTGLADPDEVSIDIPLRPGVSTAAAVRRMGFDAWAEWRLSWRQQSPRFPAGVVVSEEEITVERVTSSVPTRLRGSRWDAIGALLTEFGHEQLADRVRRAVGIGERMRRAGAQSDPRAVRALCAVADFDVEVALEAVQWLAEHEDLETWTLRQLPVQRMHTKWMLTHATLIRSLTGRDVVVESRPRVTVVHLTYADPGYLASGRRRHDAWTEGDANALAYVPRRVVIVENRDCRVHFPEMAGTIVVEGAGNAVTSLAEISWIMDAEEVVYWGDMDADGFAILDQFRRVSQSQGVRVSSILMDGAAWERYRHLGVSHDANGRELRSSRARLATLTPDEERCYALLATAGASSVRRIEQERIPPVAAREAVLALRLR